MEYSNYPGNLIVDAGDLVNDGEWWTQATALVNDGDDSELMHTLVPVPVVQSDMFMWSLYSSSSTLGL